MTRTIRGTLALSLRDRLASIPTSGVFGTKRLFGLLLLALLSSGTGNRVATAADPPVTDPLTVRAALESVRADDLNAHVAVLADDSFEGRDGGTPGGHAAAKYLALHFEKYGLEPAGEDGSYLQVFGNDFRNVLGLWRGSDPTLADDVIVIGAHFDHVGYGTRNDSYGPYGVVHNGADDNASGTSALLELIEALADAELRPRRSILFCLWDAEEDGLLGSIHWLDHPTVARDRVRFSINLDMIGRLREEQLTVYGERTAPGLRTMLARLNDEPFRLAFDWELAADSDHHPFITKGIPTLMFHTGLHDTYHRPTDDPETLDYDGIERVTRYVGRVLWELADGEQTWVFRGESWNEGEEFRKRFETPAPVGPPRLGLALEMTSGNAEGTDRSAADDQAFFVTVAAVEPGSPAAAAGLEPGMRIQAVDGLPLRSEVDFWNRINEAPQEIVVSGMRDEDSTPLKLTVELAGAPSRVGLSWRMDEGQGDLALVTRIGSMTRAERAGLQAGDRIHRIGDEPVRSTDQIRQRLTTADGSLDLWVEREGKLRRCRLDFGGDRPSSSGS
ncbi:MAG TPA: M20/M25/M40 family metallo-hydrolase [Pirellulaceae bacterium]|nr:M20/M25/M40 family metallo-hydrolase [Pirellulaceae bacterium]